ncbi:MAG: hypothetical protein KAX16_03410 [Actinomycetia bacterium]|nr:hypothetical protein [Actinomycetes bacterium]
MRTKGFKSALLSTLIIALLMALSLLSADWTSAMISTNADAGTDFQPYTSSFNILLKSESYDLGELTGEFRVTKPSENMVHAALRIAFLSLEPTVDNVILWLSASALLTEFPPPIPPPFPSNQVTLADGESIFYFSGNYSIENLETPILTFWFVIGNIQVNSEGKLWARSENWVTSENLITPLYEHSLAVGWDLDELSGVTENRTFTVTLKEMTVPVQNEMDVPNERDWSLIAGIVGILIIAIIGIVVAFYVRRY